MITLLTPSKTMDFETPAPRFVTATTPVFSVEAAKIRTLLSTYSSTALSDVMHVSPALAERVVAMYQNETVQKPALWTYVGDVFKGFQAAKLTQYDAAFAQKHLLIASGVYGLLRPYDQIQPYRLEMRANVSIDQSKNLNEFWSKRLAKFVMLQTSLDGELCVLSSEEYAKATVMQLSKAIRIVTPAFIDVKSNGKEGQVPIYNKMMRGVMANWIIINRVNSLDKLPQFSAHDYYYSPERSTANRPVYYRTVMKSLRFSTNE